MLDILHQGILTLVRNAINGEKNTVSPEFDWTKAVKTAQKHQIINMVYYGALAAEVKEDAIMQYLFTTSCIFLSKSEQQMFEIKRICEAFNQNGIEYMLLKGTKLKKLYPKSDMRVMGDADILIRPEQYDLIKPIVSGFGFTQKVESDHELTWQKSSLLLELHKRLIPSYNKDYYEYFGDGWKLAKPCREQQNVYEMSVADEFIYLFTHLSKHYRDGGIGVRHMTDLWVYLRANPDLDKEYLEKELKELKLWDFYKNVIDTLNVWFGDKAPSDKTDFITAIIFGSGAYGTHEAHLTATAVKYMKATGTAKGARRRRTLEILFPKRKNLVKRYPVLEKAPILLPVFWVVRSVSTLLFSSSKIKKQREETAFLTNERITNYQKALNYVGLDYNFKE